MQIHQAVSLTLALSAVAINAAPTARRTEVADLSRRGLASSVPSSEIGARGLVPSVSSSPIAARGIAKIGNLRRKIDEHYSHLEYSKRDAALVHDLHRRGLLDELIKALSNLIMTLLGTAKPFFRRQLVNTDAIDLAVQQITCILDTLFGNEDPTCANIVSAASQAGSATHTIGANATSSVASNSTMVASSNATVAGNSTAKDPSAFVKTMNKIGAELRSGSSITKIVDDLRHPEEAEEAHKSKKAQKKDHEKRSQLARRQQEGVLGLLNALREVLDTLLNTLLPESRDNHHGPPGRPGFPGPPGPPGPRPPFPPFCPPPGVPNDGQYRPGCPGYGRRDIMLRRNSVEMLGERDADILSAIMPMVQMLMTQLPAFIASFSESPASNSSSSATTSDASGSTDSVITRLLESFTSGGSSSASSDTSDAATSSAYSPGNDASEAARKAARLSEVQIQARSLFKADGFDLGMVKKRQTTGDGSDNCTASGNSGGLNISLLDDLLNGLFKSFGRRDLAGISQEHVRRSYLAEHEKRQTTTTTADDDADGSGNCSASNNSGGINVSLLNNILNGLLSGLRRRDSNFEGSGNSAASGNDGGLNIAILNNLLNGLLSKRGGGGGSSAEGSFNSAGNSNDGGINVAAADNLLNGVLSRRGGGGGSSAEGSYNSAGNSNDGGINVAAADNLLNGVLSRGLPSGDFEGSGNSAGNANDGGINIAAADNLLNGVLSRRAGTGYSPNLPGFQSAEGSGNSAGSGNDGGINVAVANNLLNGVLSRRSDETNDAYLQRRADFKPVWEAIRAIGNQQFKTPSTHKRSTDGGEPDFSPVWTAFRNLVDAGYAAGAKDAARQQQQKQQQQRRDMPTLDYKPLVQASANYAAQVFQSFAKQHSSSQKQHVKREVDFTQLLNAANKFAGDAMKEFVAAQQKQ